MTPKLLLQLKIILRAIHKGTNIWSIAHYKAKKGLELIEQYERGEKDDTDRTGSSSSQVL